MLLELRYQTLCNVIYTPVECVGKLLLILCIICVPCTCVCECACMHVCVCVCARACVKRTFKYLLLWNTVLKTE